MYALTWSGFERILEPYMVISENFFEVPGLERTPPNNNNNNNNNIYVCVISMYTNNNNYY